MNSKPNTQNVTNPVTESPLSSTITYAMVRRGEYVGAVGNDHIGRVLGDYSTGFWAIKLDGRRMYALEPFATPEAAFEVLALEFALHYGEVLAGTA